MTLPTDASFRQDRGYHQPHFGSILEKLFGGRLGTFGAFALGTPDWMLVTQGALKRNSPRSMLLANAAPADVERLCIQAVAAASDASRSKYANATLVKPPRMHQKIRLVRVTATTN